MGSPRGLVSVLSTGVLALSVATASHAREARLPERVPTTTAASPRLALPLGLAPDARTLADANGEPFILRGRTAWYILSLSVAGQTTFLDDTAEKRFNAIEIKAITHDENGNNPPFAGNGEAPFVTRLDGSPWDGRLSGRAPDFGTPNEAYWTHVDTFLEACEARGIVVLLFPAYVGYGGQEQGWMQEMVANGPDRMRRYGAWIARRYRERGGLIWMLGGDYSDYTPAERDVERALIDGLKSVPDQKSVLYSAEWTSDTIGTDHPDFGHEVNLNGVYSWENSVARLARKAYAFEPTLPAFLLEEPYDEEGPDGNGYNPNATQPVRRFVYWGWLNTIGGYMAGNGHLWRFRQGWHEHLDSPGSVDLAHLNELILSVESWRLVPGGLGGMKTLVAEGGGSPDAMDSVAAAATREGDLLLAYASPGHAPDFTLDLSRMQRPCRARWWDPTSGVYQEIGGLGGAMSASFSPPGENSRGDRDWLLRLDCAGAGSLQPARIPVTDP